VAGEFFIRKADVNDCTRILDCLALAFLPYREAYTPGAFADTVLDPLTLRQRLDEMSVLVAIASENRLVGTIGYQLQPDGEAHIRGMAVHPEWQGRSVAPSLLAHVESDLRARGCRAMTLGTTAVLRQAIRFYEKNGFRPTGEVSSFFGMDLFGYRKELAAIGLEPTMFLQSSYDRVADEYVIRFFNELEHKPRDRELLDPFAAKVKRLGPACDLGSGPGHIARYLHEHGVDIAGIDLSPVMVQTARRLNPGLKFEDGDMRSLTIPDDTLGGIVAFYSLIHFHRADVVAVLEEMKRVLRPGGLLLLSFHVGDNVLHRDELWGVRVSLDFTFFRTEEMKHYLEEAGLEVLDSIERDPYPDVEYPSRRAYLFAEKPARTS
jgi:SAM-dependent methyltransferase/ribosomal protein S18 acetylase RimI-like enzyme